MSKSYNVAIAGATGAVGKDMLKVLEQRDFPVNNLKLLASAQSIGKKLSFKGEEFAVEELTKDSFNNIDIALFSAGASRSKEFASAAVESGAVVVDNSSAFRMDEDVPLIIPEINPEDVAWHKGVIANPNCSTIVMLVPLFPIYKKYGIRRIVVSTYQAVSGTGMKAIQELDNQIRQYVAGEAITKEVYPYQIAFNIFPHVDVFLENGYSKEEMKMVLETKKIFHDEDIKVTATCVRVPVFRAHSESINIETRLKATARDIKDLLARAPGVEVVDDLSQNKYPVPLEATNKDDVLVGRIREDVSNDKGIDLWVSGDQLLKGAALNAVQIAELL